MWRTNSSNSVTQSNDELPPGWTKKESKSQKGKFYYISPSGKTQWEKPQIKQAASKKYNWITEIEIEFGEGRLGVSLREVKQESSVPYHQFQAEVDDLPKVNGKAGPAEIYNWGVKPNQRLKIGMRLTFIGGSSLAGYTYADVVEKLRKASRPVKLKFADVEMGTVEDNPNRSSAKSVERANHEKEAPSVYIIQKQQLTRTLVMSELHTEMWSIENKKLSREICLKKLKWETLSHEFDLLNATRAELRKDYEKLMRDKVKYENMIKQLDLQRSNAIESPEVTRAEILSKRNTELTDDITKMTAGNKKLRKERKLLTSTLDELESTLSKIDSGRGGKSLNDGQDDDFFGVDPTSSPRDQLIAFQEKLRLLEDELNKEQKKSSRAEREMEQLNRQLGKISSSGKSFPESDTSAKVESTSEAARLEAKIADLRKKQRAVVASLSKAAQSGDQSLAIECQRRRQAIKEELQLAQEELEKITGQGRERKLTRSNSSSPARSNDAKDQSSSATPSRKIPSLTGYLHKGPTEWAERGLISNMKTMRGTRERWCEITPEGKLRYFKRKGDPSPRGEIDIADTSFEVVCEDIHGGKEFVICTSSHQSHFFAKTTQEMATWVKTLQATNTYLVRSKRSQIDAAKGLDSGGGGRGGRRRQPESDEFYGRATLGF